MDLERTDDGRLRVVIALKKLGQETVLEYFLDEDDVARLTEALSR